MPYPWTIGSPAFVVGAGFSKAVDEAMPLASELGGPLGEMLGDSRFSASGDVEALLTLLCEPQPYFSEAENLRNQSVFLDASLAVGRILTDRVRRVVRCNPPSWILQFVYMARLHNLPIISFNYDDLIERAAGAMQLYRHDLWREYAVLLKLHGSIDESWDSATNEVVTPPSRLDHFHRPWMEYETLDERTPPSRYLWEEPGRWVPFIVPPASTKSRFYQNPELRDRWLAATSYLNAADTIAILGYSLPTADYATTYMLKSAINRPRVARLRLVVADLDPDSVVDRIGAVDGDVLRFGGSNAIEDAIAFLASEYALRAMSEVQALVDSADAPTWSEGAEVRMDAGVYMGPTGESVLEDTRKHVPPVMSVADSLALMRQLAEDGEVSGRKFVSATVAGSDQGIGIQLAPRPDDLDRVAEPFT